MKTARNTKNKENQSKRISNIKKPGKMTMTEWQTMLRQQAALNETFVITEQAGGNYTVKNYASDHSYTVTWIRDGHLLNSCSCMDFRTSRLASILRP